MSWLYSFWQSSIGGKVTMAVTGFLLFGFVVSHLVGNLLLLQGPGVGGEPAARFGQPALL